jgi:hypothetical protein
LIKWEGLYMEILGKKLNKKGSIQDVLLIMVVLLVFSMMLLFGFKITNAVNTQIQASTMFEANGKAAANTLTSYYPGVLDKSFLFLCIGLSIVVLILASMVRVHPIFIPIFLIGLIFLTFLSGVFSNIYQTMAADPSFATEAAQLVMINKVMTMLPWFVAIIGVLLCIVMYRGYSEARFGL